MNIETMAIHGDFSDEPHTGATAVPIFQSTAYAYSTAQQLSDVFAGSAPGYIYTRIANPTTFALERRIADLEGGIGCIATASGMSAITAVAMGLLKSGDQIIAASGIFGGTVSLFRSTLAKFGVKTVFVNASKTEQFRDVLTEDTKMIFVETIGNPRMDVPDLAGISAIAKDANVPFVVDSTITTPVLVKPKDLGADIVIHSTSKYINGHGTAIGGAIVDTGRFNWGEGPFKDIKELVGRTRKMAFLTHLRNLIYRDLGACPAPMNSFLMLQGMETLAGRMEKHCINALALAEYLDKHERVEWVNYPGLSRSEFHEIADRQFGGKASGLLTFGLDSKDRAFKFIDALRLAKNLANLGDAKTLVIHPASTIFHEFSAEEQKYMSVTPEMIRVSVGIEGFEDIKNDFEQAIKKAYEE